MEEKNRLNLLRSQSRIEEENQEDEEYVDLSEDEEDNNGDNK